MAGGLHLYEHAVHRCRGEPMDKDRIEGKKEQAKGFIKEKAGKLTNDPDLEAEGKASARPARSRKAWAK